MSIVLLVLHNVLHLFERNRNAILAMRNVCLKLSSLNLFFLNYVAILNHHRQLDWILLLRYQRGYERLCLFYLYVTNHSKLLNYNKKAVKLSANYPI